MNDELRKLLQEAVLETSPETLNSLARLLKRLGYPYIEESEVTWKTKDGRKLSPQEMDDSHLVNAFKLILSNKRDQQLKIHPIYDALLKEIQRRGLTPL